jgi:DNA-binding MarR family transcriptional regulator
MKEKIRKLTEPEAYAIAEQAAPQTNKKRLAELVRLWVSGTQSANKLSKLSGVSRPTTTNVLRALEDAQKPGLKGIISKAEHRRMVEENLIRAHEDGDGRNFVPLSQELAKIGDHYAHERKVVEIRHVLQDRYGGSIQNVLDEIEELDRLEAERLALIEGVYQREESETEDSSEDGAEEEE